jgi:cellulose synthase/poly-beta-1,6-N-acetylglucosamine synthase-like glycosyltransferase
MSLVFWFSVFLIFFAYFGYPLTLELRIWFDNKTVQKKSFIPHLTLIITACDEGKRIREKLENTLGLDYPSNLLQVIIASDGSTDATNGIVQEYVEHGFELLALPDRQGKENAQKEAVSLASGDIIVFSDVATRIEPLGLKEIAANFADPSVGCVSSVDKVIGRDGEPCGEGAYVRYEM